MKALADLSAGFGGADCYFTVSREVGNQIKELAAASSMKFDKVVKDDTDGAITVHAKSLAMLLGQPVAPAPKPVTTTVSTPTPTPTPKPATSAAKKPAPAPIVPPSPPNAETTEPGSATSDDIAAI